MNAEGVAAATLASMHCMEKPNSSIATTTKRPSKKAGRDKGKGKEDENFPVEPRIIQVVKKPRTFMNHSYRDFSCVPPVPGEEVPTDTSQMTFPQKVHHILSQPEYSRFISWQPHGRAFRVIVPKMFEVKVCSKYFGHTRYSSFLRQLSNHSFKHITQGRDRNCYYHEFMLRGLPHLCKYMPKPKDARRLIPDPANEPDFYAISEAFPLPDEKRTPPAQETSGANSGPMAQAGLVRLASDLGLAGNLEPPVKRARVATMEPAQVQAPVAATFPQLSNASLPDVRQLLESLVRGNAIPSGTPTCGSPNTSAAPAQALPPLPFSAPMTSAPSTAGANCCSLPPSNCSVWPALRTAQMQAAQDRNASVLAALRESLQAQQTAASVPPQTPQVSNTTDLAAVLAAALIEQVNSGAAGSKEAAVNGLKSLLSNSF